MFCWWKAGRVCWPACLIGDSDGRGGGWSLEKDDQAQEDPAGDGDRSLGEAETPTRAM